MKGTGETGWSGLAVVVAALLVSCAPAQPSPGMPPRRAAPSAASTSADAGAPDPRDSGSESADGDTGPRGSVILCNAIGCADKAVISVVLPIPSRELVAAKTRICVGTDCVRADGPTPTDGTAVPFPSAGSETMVPLSAASTRLRFVMTVPPDLSVDGTVYSVQVDTPTRGRVLNVSRALRTTSKGFHPAGPLCGTPCRLVVARWYPNSRSGIACNSDPCESGLVVHLDVRNVLAELGGASVVQMCRNALCVDASLPRLDHIVEGGWSTAPVEGLMVGSLVEFHPPGELRIKVLSDPIALRANDRYVVRLYTEAHKLLWSYETVANYESSFPNGVECDTVPCKTMAVHAKP